MYTINFLAHAIDKTSDYVYESFLIPYAFFAWKNNPNSHIEIVVIDKDKFQSHFSNEIEWLTSQNVNFLIRNQQKPMNRHLPNTYRFFEVPEVKAKYTYICDIDIMLLESILPHYEKNWPLNLPYNNKLRYRGVQRLTGVHMIKTELYYTPDWKQIQEKMYQVNESINDEFLLGEMCRVVHGLPPFSHRFRPILGIHFSPNRGPQKCMELETSQHYYDLFQSYFESYPELHKMKIFTDLKTQLETTFLIKSEGT